MPWHGPRNGYTNLTGGFGEGSMRKSWESDEEYAARMGRSVEEVAAERPLLARHGKPWLGVRPAKTMVHGCDLLKGTQA